MFYIKELVSNKEIDKTPIWLMRQAGRYLKDYLKIKEQHSSFLSMCYNPETAAKITMLPIEKMPLDAAIIFSDILTIPNSLGLKVEFIQDQGPSIEKISKKNFDKLSIHNDKLQPTYEALKIVKKKLPVGKELIGFSGAPWTLLSYMIEGKGSKNFAQTKVFTSYEPQITKQIIKLLVEVISQHLLNQIEAGADIIQIFDSWAGFVTEDCYYDMVIEPTAKIVSNIREKNKSIPIIGFPRRSSFMYGEYIKGTGVDVISIDEFFPLKNALRIMEKHDVIIQGNLDPRCLLCDKSEIKDHVARITKTLGKGRFIFNLGHGVLPNTPLENVKYLTSLLKND